MTRKYRKEHDLMGFEAEDLIDIFDHVEKEDLTPYFYPSDEEIEQVGVRGIYLNNYLRWDTKAQHEQMIKLYNYETRIQTRTFDTYNDVDCFHYSDTHDYIKWLKFGYGKVLDHATREIRFGRLSREEGIKLVKRYQYNTPKTTDLFLNWMGIDSSAFDLIIDQHRDPKVWKRNINNWKWELLDSIENHIYDKGIDLVRLNNDDKNKDFIITKNKRLDYKDDKYVLIGKGVID